MFVLMHYVVSRGRSYGGYKVSPGHLRAWWLLLTAITIKANKIEADMFK